MLPLNRFSISGCILLAATFLFAGWNLRKQNEVLGWVDHTNLVIQGSQLVRAEFVDAETAQRGFLVTGSESYLKPYRRALAALPGDIRALRQLIIDNPAQQRRLDQLDGFAQKRLRLLAQGIDVYRAGGRDAAREFVLVHAGEADMDAIRSLLAQFETEENKVLNIRIQRRSANLRNVILAVIGSFFLGLISFLVAGRQHGRLKAEQDRANRSHQELRILQGLVEQAPMGILMLDRQLRQLQVSQCWLDDMGLTREQVLGRNHLETYPGLPARWIEGHRRALAGEKVSGKDDHFIGPDGREHWVDWRITPWGSDGETTGGIVIYSEDITRRKHAEASARQNESQYRALFENMPDGVAYCHMVFEEDEPKDFTFLAANSGFGSFTGTRDVAGRKNSELFPDGDPALLRLYGRVARTGVSEKVDYNSQRGGKWLHLSVYSPEQGFFVLIVQDITQRKREEAIARQWQRAFEESRSGIALIDALTGKISAANAAYSRSLGYTPDELAGQDISLLYPENELAHRDAVLRAAESEKGHVLFETLHVRKNGTSFPVLADITLIWDESGTPISHVKIVHDLTEIKRTSEALRTSEARARSLFENASQGILTADAEGRIVDANAMVQRLFGYTSSELIGQPVEILMPGSLGGQDIRYRADYGIELTAARKDGREFPVEVSLTYVAEYPGGLAIAFVSDITERKQVDAALRESEAQFRTLANTIPHLCWMANADGWIFWYNQRWYDYTGITMEQAQGWGWEAAHDPDLLPEIVERWNSSLTTGDPFEMVFPLRGADGAFRAFLTRGTPVRNSAGKVVRWFGTNTDISEQLRTEQVLRSRTQQLEAANEHLKRASDALRTSEARARSLFENASQGILTIDASGRVVDANAMVQRLFGYTPSELIGMEAETLLPAPREGPYADYQARYLKHPRTRAVVQGIDLIAVRQDGTEFPVEISLSFVAEEFVGDEQDGLLIAFVSDITGRKKADREREGLIVRLEEALAEKTVLLQEVHHRVKNNLAIVAALLGMQSGTIEDDRARTALETSQRRVMSMSRIHEFLYATKNLDRVAFGKYVEQLTRELCEAYSVSMAVDVSISVDSIDLPVDQAIPCGLILNELLSNALKYAFPEGRAGKITVRFVRLESGDLALSCSDNGVGMPANFRWQTAKSLGLRIVRILSTQIHGDLNLDSGARGTQFELRFPASSDYSGRGEPESALPITAAQG